jgi:peptidoglycan/LPS O-acetylase OafA/YrhL
MNARIQQFLDIKEDRIIGLDILRSLSVLQIIWIHGVLLIPSSETFIYRRLFPINIDGVSMFFVLSGFLIGTILIKSLFQTNFNHKDLLHFWIRRWFRTLPLYYLILTLLFSLQYFLAGNPGNFNWKFLFFAQNLLNAPPVAFQESWSLSVEEWFYLLLPIMIYAFYQLTRNKHQTVGISLVLLIAMPLIARGLLHYKGYSHLRDVVPFRMDSLGFGVAGAYVAWRWPDFFTRIRYKMLIVGVLLFLILSFIILITANQIIRNPVYYSLEAFTILCFFPYLSTLRSTKFTWLNTIVVYISMISYSLYLVHSTPIRGYLLPYINRIAGLNPDDLTEYWKLNLSLYWLLSLIIATFLFKFYEKPMMSLRDRFSPNKKRESI